MDNMQQILVNGGTLLTAIVALYTAIQNKRRNVAEIESMNAKTTMELQQHSAALRQQIWEELQRTRNEYEARIKQYVAELEIMRATIREQNETIQKLKNKLAANEKESIERVSKLQSVVDELVKSLKREKARVSAMRAKLKEHDIKLDTRDLPDLDSGEIDIPNF